MTTTHIKNSFINTRIDPRLKNSSQKVLEKLGIGMSEAVNMFLSQVVLQQGLPFSVKIPNAKTKESIDQVLDPVRKSKLKKYNSLESVFAELEK